MTAMTSGRSSEKPKVSQMQFRFWVEEKLRNSDTDQFGHVNNASIATFCEAGRMGLFDEPPMQRAMSGKSIVVVRLLIEFRKEIFYPGIVRVGSDVVSVGRTSFNVVQGIFAGDGLVATSDATCVMCDAASRKPIPVPDKIRNYLLLG
jgi:acyl-CoA thioester hydrolase